ncbi:MAG: hypothetical protein N4J56_007390 [Chroococcidiopsis sp. SAG 2025]|uniref:hypothetical protein n=1 Tax=Chroococcidiopsis sp. SAG 2025 TaxID=171389 RepID=UPI0029370A6B|nr:hypothetical protein [Chroococcidiopsis sp. SAG 2025]MDV2997685.1 hypothetical protein [Chroococcidiopsis sp. SAG 2025]
MKQRPHLRRTHQLRQRFSLGDFVMPSYNPTQPRTIVVQLKFFDSLTAITAALPIVEELMQEIELLQQRQQITQLQPSAQITLRFSFHGSDAATATIAQAINNSAYQLEELRSQRQITDFAVEYEILHSKHSRRQHSDDF